jgi:hypothetical protein
MYASSLSGDAQHFRQRREPANHSQCPTPKDWATKTENNVATSGIFTQFDGDWAFMGSQEAGQKWDTARRYQLATVAYVAGAAHYHLLPAMRSMFKALLGQLIAKMLHREVWGYWYLTSQPGTKAYPDLKELRKPWADPICSKFTSNCGLLNRSGNGLLSECLHYIYAFRRKNSFSINARISRRNTPIPA